MISFRKYLAAFCALLLVVTSHSMAQARGTTDADGQIVICTGTGPITVLVDGDGQPMERGHVCPDCAMSLFAGEGAPFDTPVLTLRGGERLAIMGAVAAVQLRTMRATARGPPPFI